MIDANNGGSIDAMTRHLLSMAEQQKEVHPHYYGVTKLNLAVNAVNQDQPIAAAAHAREAIDALEGTSSRIELSAAFAALAHPLTLLGELDQAQLALSRAFELDDVEPNLEHADLADSYTDPDAAGPLLETLRINQETTAPLLFALQAAWFYGRRRRYDEAAAIFAQSVHAEGVYLSGETARRTTAAYIAAVSESDQGHSLATQAVESARKQGGNEVAANCGPHSGILRFARGLRHLDQGRRLHFALECDARGRLGLPEAR